MSELSDYQRGLQEGARDARIDEAFVRLNKINGSVDRHAKSNETLAKEVRDTRELLNERLGKIEEQMRLDRERVKVAADTLAAETERRRKELEDASAHTSGAWSLRANKATVASALVAIVAVLAALHSANII